ncbi:hypothetical protein VitviT2T_011301 [Vitis vinifera]|uniref:Extradiol ring-cleavage dioxygenase class III enzyme subunit B domain-containing protein n=1 Tax=Vitis vinifera TaxID=29760 RepID=A0ABY9CB59_VITVI|nr:hypothetical protein VitviT2T_011301 [Vitis vinifera]
MYKLKYPKLLELQVKELLMASSFKCVNDDKKHGLGHGTWIPFMLMYPEADILVCQFSIQTKRDGSCHYNMGGMGPSQGGRCPSH